MRRNEQNKNKFYQDGPYRGLPIEHTSETWLADFMLEKAAKKDSGLRTYLATIGSYTSELELVDSYLYDLYLKCGQDEELFNLVVQSMIDGNGSFEETQNVQFSSEEYANLVNISNEYYEYLYSEIRNKTMFRPIIDVPPEEKKSLHDAIDRYLHAMFEEGPQFMDDKGVDAQYLIYWLLKNLTNSDTINIVDYVNRYADFVSDETFLNMRQIIKMGTIDKKDEKTDSVVSVDFYTTDMDEYEPGYETPYLMLFWAAPKGENVPSTEKVRMPFIRYGIEHSAGEKTAYVYAIQRRTLQNNELEKVANRIFAGSRSGVSEHRDVTPSMLCVVTSFIGMLNAKGIKKLKAPDFILRRWGEFWNSDTDEKDAQIQASATDRFLTTFLRADMQFEGVDIEWVPNEIDSFLHIRLADKISSKNETLQKFFEMGRSAAMVQNKLHSWSDVRNMVASNIKIRD